MLNPKRVLGLVLFAIFIASVTALAADLPLGGSFTDDDGNVHEGYIEAIAAEGITRGCNPPDNTEYCPKDSITRGQMAAFLVRALDLPPGSEDAFVDDADSIFEGDINALAAAGITKGCNPPKNDRLCPNDNVTRGQMAAFLVRALDLPPSDDDRFVDDEGSVFEGDINALAAAGITKGCNPPANDRFCPDALVHRDQMASFLGRALGLTPITPPPPTTTTTATTSTTTTTTPPTTTYTTTTTTVPPDPDVAWSCLDLFGGGTWYCDGNIDKTDVSAESWSCSNLFGGGTWYCDGNIDKTDVSAESWSCSNLFGGGTWYCDGNIDKTDASAESWSCSNLFGGGTWYCDGNIDKTDVSAESWSCSNLFGGGTWYCDGNIDKTDASAESWSCGDTFGTGTWYCDGDTGKLSAVVSPIPVPLIASES